MGDAKARVCPKPLLGAAGRRLSLLMTHSWDLLSWNLGPKAFLATSTGGGGDAAASLKMLSPLVRALPWDVGYSGSIPSSAAGRGGEKGLRRRSLTSHKIAVITGPWDIPMWGSLNLSC